MLRILGTFPLLAAVGRHQSPYLWSGSNLVILTLTGYIFLTLIKSYVCFVNFSHSKYKIIWGMKPHIAEAFCNENADGGNTWLQKPIGGVTVAVSIFYTIRDFNTNRAVCLRWSYFRYPLSLMSENNPVRQCLEHPDLAGITVTGANLIIWTFGPCELSLVCYVWQKIKKTIIRPL